MPPSNFLQGLWQNPWVRNPVKVVGFAGSFELARRSGLSQDPDTWVDLAEHPIDFTTGRYYQNSAECRADPKGPGCDHYHYLTENGARPWLRGGAATLALTVGGYGWFRSYRKWFPKDIPELILKKHNLGSQLDWKNSLLWTGIYFGVYGIGRAVSDMEGSARLRGDPERNAWTISDWRPTEDPIWSIFFSEMLLRLWYAPATYVAMDISARASAWSHFAIAQRVRFNPLRTIFPLPHGLEPNHASLSEKILRFNETERTQLINAGRQPLWRGAGALTVGVVAAVMVYEGFEAFNRLSEQESPDPVWDVSVAVLGAVAATIAVSRLVFGGSLFRNLTDGTITKLAMAPTATRLMVRPDRLAYFGNYLFWTGTTAGLVNMGLRAGQGFNGWDVLLAEHFRTYISPIPSNVFENIWRAITDRPIHLFYQIAWGNWTIYQTVSVLNQLRQTGSMRYRNLAHRYVFTSPEERKSDEPLRRWWECRIKKKLPDQFKNLAQEKIQRFRDLLASQLLASRPLAIEKQLDLLEEEIARGELNRSTQGGLFRRSFKRLGSALWIGGQRPSLDLIEEDLGRLGKTLEEENRMTEETEGIFAEMERLIGEIDQAHREFFRAISESERIDAMNIQYRIPPSPSNDICQGD